MASEPNIYKDGVEVLAPCVYTANNMSEAIGNLAQNIQEASDTAWDVYGSGKSQNYATSDSFMDDIAEAFAD